MTTHGKGRRHNAVGRASASDMETELARLSTSDLRTLRAEWKNRFAGDPPPVRSRDILRRLIGWQLQAEAFGGLDKKTGHMLQNIAERLERDGSYEPALRSNLAPGIELAREWKGAIHKVTVVPGGFRYLGKRYASLSDIARTITGTRWSGPRFFGLEQRRKTVNRQISSIGTGEPA